MHKLESNFVISRGLLRTFTIAIGLMIPYLCGASPSLAQTSVPEVFSSAEAASTALFNAVRSNDEYAIMRILGSRRELLLSNDEIEDKRDREQFAQKYQEMHRLVQESGGNTFLYIGAENWPFPIPLVSKASEWHFEPKTGAREILFRRVGENEITAIEVCHSLVLASKKSEAATDDDPLDQYANTILARQGGGEAANGQVVVPFHGYFFRILKQSSDGNSGLMSVAYPAEYRSSGVMTFLTNGGVVYEADLGPKTANIAKSMTTWKRTSLWHVTDQITE